MSYFSQTKGERDVKNSVAAVETRIETPAHKPSHDIVSTLGPGLLVTGKVISTGTVQIFGRVVGDIHVAQLVIAKGAEVEGTIKAQDTAIEGKFTGSIHSNNVKLQSTAVVDGEIFKQSLVIEQNAQFEGVARRLETAIDAPTAEQLKAEKPAPALQPVQSYNAPVQQDYNSNGGMNNGVSEPFHNGGVNGYAPTN